MLWVKKLGVAGSFNFSSDTANFWQHSSRWLHFSFLMKNINFACKFFQMRVFSPTEDFLTAKNLRWAVPSIPQCHCLCGVLEHRGSTIGISLFHVVSRAQMNRLVYSLATTRTVRCVVIALMQHVQSLFWSHSTSTLLNAFLEQIDVRPGHQT